MLITNHIKKYISDEVNSSHSNEYYREKEGDNGFKDPETPDEILFVHRNSFNYEVDEGLGVALVL